MSKKEKLVARLRSKPSDFSWRELQTLMNHLGFEEVKGSGSRRRFVSRTTRRMANLHKRHPDGTLLAYQIRDVLAFLEQEGCI